MPRSAEYSWKKVWAVQTSNDDESQVGEEITVGGQTRSRQRIVSVTTMKNRQGKPYKVFLTEEV